MLGDLERLLGRLVGFDVSAARGGGSGFFGRFVAASRLPIDRRPRRLPLGPRGPPCVRGSCLPGERYSGPGSGDVPSSVAIDEHFCTRHVDLDGNLHHRGLGGGEPLQRALAFGLSRFLVLAEVLRRSGRGLRLVSERTSLCANVQEHRRMFSERVAWTKARAPVVQLLIVIPNTLFERSRAIARVTSSSARAGGGPERRRHCQRPPVTPTTKGSVRRAARGRAVCFERIQVLLHFEPAARKPAQNGASRTIAFFFCGSAVFFGSD